MKFLALKHVVVEGLGVFEQFCNEAGIVVDTVELELDHRFPTLDDYAALWVMGGPMNVSDEADYPWLKEEKVLIKKAVQLRMPYMGVCLGAQLLADALGGEVRAMSAPEVGWLPVNLAETGRDRSLTTGLPEKFNVLQWHGQEVRQLPANATLLASSAQCRVQAYAVNDCAFGIQFHTEVTSATVDDWVQIPSYRADLEATLGATGCDDLKQAIAAHLTTINATARILFNNFLRVVEIERK